MPDSHKEFLHTELFSMTESLHEMRVGRCVDRILPKMETDATICPEAGSRCFCSSCSLANDQSTH